MKKLLLALSAVTLSAASVSAQRLALYEEFSGENCAPCAASNPGLWTLLSANTSKVMLLKYQSPIPSAGPIYNAYPTQTSARLTYYSVPFAPYGRLDGTGLGTGTAAPSSPGHVANLTQADINAAAAVPTPFTMTISHTWNATGDSVTANVSITAASAYAPAGANFKLRIAIIEHLVYATPPGTNGEKDFHNVVREMVPNAAGYQLPNTWTAGTQNFTVKGKVTNILDKTNSECVLVAWIQNDNGKSIEQVAKSTKVAIPMDAGITATVPASKLACAAGTTANVTSTVTLKNTGTTTLTSAKIYYRADNTPYGTTPVSWTGSLAPGSTASVSIPAVSLSVGSRSIVDSIAMPNGSADINGGNNVGTAMVTVVNTTPNPLPLTTGFENSGSLPANWIIYDFDGNGNVPVMGYSTSSNIGHRGSKYVCWFRFPYEPSGETNYVIMPSGNLPSGTKTLEFWVAHALRTGAGIDKLEVVYSTNCGSTWSSAWSKTGTQLSTAPATANGNAYVPAGESEWKAWSVDMTSVPAGAMIAFRGVGSSGQNMFVDDVNLLAGGPTGVENIISNGQVNLFPNPARENATLEFTQGQSSHVIITLIDAIGRTVATVADETLKTGPQRFTISTSNLAAGSYNVIIHTEAGTITQRLSVVK